MATSGIRSEPPLIVIVGPTASGKTSVAIELAKRLDGEIICADSRTVYKGMDIGTAKPTSDEQAQVPHWGIDLVSPGKRFTAADFKLYAERKIGEIRARGKTPMLVGGTGLYIDSVIFNFDFTNHKQHGDDWRQGPRERMIIAGIAVRREILRQRIYERVEQLFSNGVVEEATKLGKKYGWDAPAMTGNIYPIVHSYLGKEVDLEAAVDKSTTQDWQLAKRQMTWFRPNPFIQWCDLSEVSRYIESRIVSE